MPRNRPTGAVSVVDPAADRGYLRGVTETWIFAIWGETAATARGAAVEVPIVRYTAGRRRSADPALDSAWRCAACGAPIEWGDRAWRQRVGSARGCSHVRFCDTCVTGDHPPMLQVIPGGKEK